MSMLGMQGMQDASCCWKRLQLTCDTQKQNHPEEPGSRQHHLLLILSAHESTCLVALVPWWSPLHNLAAQCRCHHVATAKTKPAEYVDVAVTLRAG